MSGMRANVRRVSFAATLTCALAGCGAPSVTPAGSAGMIIPYVDPVAATTLAVAAPPPTAATTAAPTVNHRANPKGSATPAAVPASEPVATAAAAPVAAVSAPKPKPKPAPAKTHVITGKPVEENLALPKEGTYNYALTGSSSIGPPAATMHLTVGDGSPSGQLWTLDGRRSDGGGLVEEFTLTRDADGIHLHTYRLDASTGTAGVILDFQPSAPLLFEPDRAATGQTWEFDMTSTDGCASSHTTATMVAAGGPGSLRHLRLHSDLNTIGPVSCIPVHGQRTEDLYHPSNAVLPSRIDSDLSGTLAGIPVRATTSATTAGVGDTGRNERD
jgi:hypothetical protein